MALNSRQKVTLESVHEGKKYPCDACDHIATQQGHLRIHKQSVHEGKKYPCDACDHFANQEGNLRIHRLG